MKIKLLMGLFLCILQINGQCWKNSYGRGVGSRQLVKYSCPLHINEIFSLNLFVAIPDSCPSGQENNAGLCYQLCPNGYTGYGPVCWQA